MEVASGQPLQDIHRTGAGVGDRLDADHDIASLSDERSVAASQASTVDTAASSQMHAHLGSKESSHSSLDHYDTDRNAMDLGGREPNLNGLPSNVARLPPLQTNMHDAKPVNGVDEGYGSDVRQGQKRTASGHVKTPSSTNTITSSDGTGAPHKRNTSVNTQVNELSAQLRARLSYALLKVQNGWEGRTLDEVEALTALHGSPKSNTSPWRSSGSPQLLSPSTRFQSRASAAATQASNILNGNLKYQTASATPTSPYMQPPNRDLALPNSSIPSLAPPVDFDSRTNSRRTTNAGRPTPYLGNGTGPNRSNVSASSASSVGSNFSALLNPATPPLQETPGMTLQTPSQRATASERDAIETLLFMSSPGNSQTFRNMNGSASQARPLAQGIQHSSPRGQPLSASPQRARLQGMKQVSFLPSTNTTLAIDAADRIPLSPRKRGLLDNADLETEAGIDRVLDQMPIDGDGESSSDESLGSVGPRLAQSESQVTV